MMIMLIIVIEVMRSVKEELILESSIDSDAEHVQLDRSDERLALMKMKVNLFSTNLICAILMRLQ